MPNSRLDIFAHKFVIPTKQIKTEHDVRIYTRSVAFKSYKFFMEGLADSVIAQPYSQGLQTDKIPYMLTVYRLSVQ